MVRNLIGSVLAAIGATAAVWSPFRAWYDGRLGQDIRVQDLFTGITTVNAGLWTSLLLPMAAGALLTLIGILLRSRAVVAVAGVVVLGFTVLWMVRQGQAAGSLTIGGPGGVDIGAALATGGGLLILLGALVMRGRRPRSRLHEDEYGHPPHEPYEPYEPYEDEYEYPPPHEPEPHPYGQAPQAPYGQAPQHPYNRPRPGGYPTHPGEGPPPGAPSGPRHATPPYGTRPPPDPDETRTMPPVQQPPPPPPPPGRRGPQDPGGRPPQQ